MPGLTGILYREVNNDNIHTSVENMITLLLHEDYYVTDRKVDKHFALGSIDLNKGDFVSRVIEDDSYILGFTGQIYDQEVLLEKISGDSKKTIDLPNLLLNLYKKYGPEGLAGLNGLYVAVIWDKKARRLHIVNDRYGFRKLYYWNGGNKFVFASEYKAISWFPDFPKKIDEFAFANLMTFGYVLDDRTLFEDIKLLPPASIAIVQDGTFSIRKYWDYSFYEEGDPKLSEDEYIDALAQKLTTAVKKRVNGVNRLSLPLSGGLDSRTMAAVLYRLNSVDYIKAYSYGHRHCYDVRFGKKIAKKLGFPHETIEITPDFINKHTKIFIYLDEAMAACDWAWGIISKKKAFAKDNINAVLTGFLGDVLFGSNLSFNSVLNTTKDNEAITKIYHSHIDSFNDQESERYLNQHVYQRIRGHNLQVIQQTYNNAPTDNILNRARYVNLQQRQRKFTCTQIRDLEFFAYTFSPFIDNDFVDFVTHVPAELQVKQSLYKKMLIRHFPIVVKIGYSATGYPIKPYRWQEALKWRLDRHIDLLKKISFGLYGTHDYNEYRHTAHALRTASREFMIKSFNNIGLKEAFFRVEMFDDLVADFLGSKSERYEKVCYPLTFFVWADVFRPDEFGLAKEQ